MRQGHGDDIYQYPETEINFSSNIYAHADLSALKEHLGRHLDLIGNYPEPEALSLERLIASKHGIPADSVLVTSGATEAIYLIAQAAVNKQMHHYSTGPYPTFSEYDDASTMFGLTRHEGGQQADTLLWLCNPNNPTGHIFSNEELAEASRRHALLVVDQSYEDYTLAPLMTHREAAHSANILQLHSLTKTYAVPGLRIGYVVAAPALISLLRQYIRPWSVNALAIEAGKWLVEHDDARAVPDVESYLAEAQRLNRQLNAIPGIEALPTHTNFMLARIHRGTAAELKDYLAHNHRMLIRDASNFRGLTLQHFRVSTQRKDENSLLLESIQNYLS